MHLVSSGSWSVARRAGATTGRLSQEARRETGIGTAGTVSPERRKMRIRFCGMMRGKGWRRSRDVAFASGDCAG